MEDLLKAACCYLETEARKHKEEQETRESVQREIDIQRVRELLANEVPPPAQTAPWEEE